MCFSPKSINIRHNQHPYPQRQTKSCTRRSAHARIAAIPGGYRVKAIKNIHSYTELRKYFGSDYIRVSEGIYSHQREYVPTLSFEQEADLGEGGNSAEIS
jgi:hypothetical protein